jgi:hypothetical protein
MTAPASGKPSGAFCDRSGVHKRAIALAAIAGTTGTTRLTLRHQWKAENRRRRDERHMHLLDSGHRVAVDFLAAGDCTTRARQALDTAHISLDGAKSSSDDKTYQHFGAAVEEARESASAVVADAEDAYAACAC